ncbi:hypothetical protein EVA_12405 [gut metagenome]|uniref:Uncharacterized protein n=1 Tax=gut metagenome TaxID=749906 RepID=J9FWV7_9ZZZZ
MTTKPYRVDLKPDSILASPRLGPINRSSTISIGAAREPARRSNAVSVASTAVIRPEICTRPPPISCRTTGAVTTSPLPFSNRIMAIRLPTLSRVTSLKILAPRPSSSRFTVGS